VRLLEDEKYRQEVIASDKGEALLLALYAIAFEDASKAIEPASSCSRILWSNGTLRWPHVPL